MIDGFGTQVDRTSLEAIEDELMSLVGEGLLEMGMSEGGEVVFWHTDPREELFGIN